MERTMEEVIVKIKEKAAKTGSLSSLHSVVLNEYAHYKVIVSVYFTETQQEIDPEHITVGKSYSLASAKHMAKEVADVLKKEFPTTDISIRMDKVGG